MMIVRPLYRYFLLGLWVCIIGYPRKLATKRILIHAASIGRYHMILNSNENTMYTNNDMSEYELMWSKLRIRPKSIGGRNTVDGVAYSIA